MAARYRGIGDLVDSFSPASDLFAVAFSDGRIKVWDTVKGQLQTEFTDIDSQNDTLLQRTEDQRGHLAIDYKCMEWVKLQGKKKKPGSLLLVLGTGNGDVLAIDVAVGQLKWKVSDCNPGGVNAVSYSERQFCIYTAGVDGMVCQIDVKLGSLLSKFRASTKAISSMSISADGNTLVTASGQLKIFNCVDHKKIKKLSGHSLAVRCITFSEKGDYILSSAVGERYVAIWRNDEDEKRHASCILSMEHPPIFLDCKGTDATVSGLYVLAISEMGVCYFWHGNSLNDLQNSKPSKISLSNNSSLSNDKKGLAIFSAKFQDAASSAFGNVLFAFGSLIKPSFQKLLVQDGKDATLTLSRDGVLLPHDISYSSHPGQAIQAQVTALDRANAEDAVNPLPKLYLHEKKRKHSTKHMVADNEKTTLVPIVDAENLVSPLHVEGYVQEMDENSLCLEDRSRAVGILGEKPGINNGRCDTIAYSSATKLAYNGVELLADSDITEKKARELIQAVSPSDAYKLLEALVSAWRTSTVSSGTDGRPACSKLVLLWIKLILLNHKNVFLSQNSSRHLFKDLLKITSAKSIAVQPLLKLSGSLQLINAQMDKSCVGLGLAQRDDAAEGGSDEEDEDVEELLYGQEEDDDTDSSKGGSDADDSNDP